MPLTTEQLRRKLATARLTVPLAANLDPDAAAVFAEAHAGDVEFTDDGDVDPKSLQAVASAIIEKAPSKFRLTDADRRSAGDGAGPNFYENLREAVARRHAGTAQGGVAALSERLNLPRGAA